MARPKGSKNKAVSMEEPEAQDVPAQVDGTVDENVIHIDNLPMIKAAVIAEMAEKKLNPAVVQEGEAGVVFIQGEPMMVIDNQYVPHDEAQLVLQERKVVREWIRLENLKQGIKE